MRRFLVQQKYTFILLGLVLVGLNSCSYKNKNILFKTKKEVKSNDPVKVIEIDNKNDSLSTYRHRIKVGDRLQVKFLNNYDIGQGASQSATSFANSSATGVEEKGYLVNYDSTTTLPLIGRINIVGLTRLEAAKKLEDLYSKFIINPIIDLNIANLSVTILGEVNIPGKTRIDKETTTLIDVIALAGGLKDFAKKNQNARIIRGNKIILVDLGKIGAIGDPELIIHDNDVIYIEPYGVKAATEPFNALLPVSTLLIAVTQLVILSFQLYNLAKTK